MRTRRHQPSGAARRIPLRRLAADHPPADMLHPFALLAALLQAPTSHSSPPGGDTTGYWQQRASYAIVASLDERRGVLEATGRLTYVNHSPDTLRELYLHQHLNAFRPGSAWSAVDEREGRVRFQRLADPDHAFERFTAAPLVEGRPVAPEYPGAPDSTVVRLALPRPLAPGDTLRVELAWEARPSTLPRRQGRRGRSFDFAQWYPKVAVYDRGGWQPYALRPAGEFYGEFGDFDVTLLLADDQVLGTTGEVVEGDPGWRRALRWGTVALPEREPAASPDGDGDPIVAPPGMRRVRVVARDVHHFGWSVSPDYRYEGAWFVRTAWPRATRVVAPESVAVHVLYRPGDERTWGSGQVVARTNVTLRWLEGLYGPYPYPQMTVLHRIESGGTEFPMLQMNGSPSQGLNLHEGGHVYSYGILANNEWNAGWMDEGLTSYQTAWAQLLTPQDRPRRSPAPPPVPAPGYAGLALRPRPDLLALTAQARRDLLGGTDPIATPSHEFRDFGVYNAMIYGRAESMFGALRDAVGDAAFRRFLRTYYDRWALRHVDEAALRRAAEDAAGAPLDWFFEQWLHRTGVVDYALRDVRVRAEGDGWVTTARVERQGDYRHPMPLGVRVDTGWVLVRASPLDDRQTLTVRTATRPREVRLDPWRTTPDWYAPNDHDVALPRLDARTSVRSLDWPFLDQSLADRYATLVAPLLWYTGPGGATVGARARTSYVGLFDRHEAGLALAARADAADVPAGGATRRAPRESSRLQGWLVQENPKPWGSGRPLMGVRAGIWRLDGITKVELGRTWDSSRLPSSGDRVSHALVVTGTYPFERAVADGRRWSGRSATDLAWRWTRAPTPTSAAGWRVSASAGVATESAGARAYGTAAASWTSVRRAPTSRVAHYRRLYAGVAADAPPERALHLAAESPTATFASHLWRGEGAPLAHADMPYRPLGGAGLRGYDALARTPFVLALNLEEALRVGRFGPAARPLDLDVTLFGDVAGRGVPDDGDRASARLAADAGVGLALRGAFFDRDVRLRLDLPLWVADPELAVGARDGSGATHRRFRPRLAFSFSDLW